MKKLKIQIYLVIFVIASLVFIMAMFGTVFIGRISSNSEKAAQYSMKIESIAKMNQAINKIHLLITETAFKKINNVDDTQVNYDEFYKSKSSFEQELKSILKNNDDEEENSVKILSSSYNKFIKLCKRYIEGEINSEDDLVSLQTQYKILTASMRKIHEKNNNSFQEKNEKVINIAENLIDNSKFAAIFIFLVLLIILFIFPFFITRPIKKQTKKIKKFLKKKYNEEVVTEKQSEIAILSVSIDKLISKVDAFVEKPEKINNKADNLGKNSDKPDTKANEFGEKPVK